MRRPIIAGNWKMHNTINEAVELVNGLNRNLADVDSVDIVVCPTYTALSDVNELLIDSNIALGAQDVYWEEKGAFTGEISPQMLKDVGASYCIIGHSERRKYFNETNETVNKKTKAALNAGLLPIVCVGESLEEREANRTFDVIKDHIEGSLQGLSKENMANVTIAYEPVWAIGTGKNATPDQAQEVHKYIRGLLKDLFDEEVANNTRIQYGGSVKPDNIKDLISEEDVDGALVGGASLKVDSFTGIVKGAVT
ncbi:MAG: triose-phosphate isomerase [Candidatus Omnitrophica bacterium]|nr:triose-phosphate isomerase [Candidatus Omnitrophota bacterium]